MKKPHILVTGALGQIGRVLVDRLVDQHGADAVLATDLADHVIGLPCRYASLDATDADRWQTLAEQHSFKLVYHLVAVLSASGEARPWRSWDINMTAWKLALEHARGWPECKLFFPSSIAVYGPPVGSAPDESVQLWPTTSYGIAKAAGEQWAWYYTQRYGLDVRCLRLPGVIGYQTKPGGGTTDYAVDIFHHAVTGKPFTCFLQAGSCLPMIYMEDVIRGMMDVMKPARRDLIREEHHADPPVFNLTGFSVSPQELAQAIKKELPSFEIEYAPDHRQAIADSWPDKLDATKAQTVWGWQPSYDLAATVQDMLLHLSPAKTQTPQS